MKIGMDTDKLKLSWDEFEMFTTSTLTGLYMDQDFVDVTLACEDGKQMKAHKVVLSSCSSFFKNILLMNPHPSPLIYLKGVKLSVLQAILKFIYLGQTEVVQEGVTSFLAIAKELEIKGLMEENITQTDDCCKTMAIKEDTSLDLFEFELDTNQEDSLLEKEVNKMEPNTKIKETSGIGKYMCSDCEYKTNHRKHMNTHELSVHANVQFECDECTKAFSDPSSLRRHKKTNHEGVRYACDQCNKSSTTTFHLATHKRIKHSA